MQQISGAKNHECEIILTLAHFGGVLSLRTRIPSFLLNFGVYQSFKLKRVTSESRQLEVNVTAANVTFLGSSAFRLDALLL